MEAMGGDPMIAVEDLFVDTQGVEIDKGIVVVAVPNGADDRAADIEFKIGDAQFCEQDFAAPRFDIKLQKMCPVVTILSWGSILVVLGLRRWVVLNRDPARVLCIFDLFRSDRDDSGFYKVSFNLCDGLLLGVYEGGVVAISPLGELLWHKSKNWEDEFISVVDGRLVFLVEGGGRYGVDCKTGVNASLP